MKVFEIKLSDEYPFLVDESCSVTAYIQGSLAESDCNGMIYTQPRPAMVICPGGGYHFVSGREAEPIALSFLPKGFNVFILKYSIHPEFHYPEQLRELAATVDLLNKRSEEFNIDPEKTVLCGFSAGGHLVAHYCTKAADDETITSVIEPGPAAAAILGYPVISGLINPHQGSLINYFGVSEATEEQKKLFSAELHIKPGFTPPTFLWHTATDKSVNVTNSFYYAMALKQAGVPFSMHIFPAGRHGLATSDSQTVHDYDDKDLRLVAGWTDMATEWLRNINIIR